MLGYLCWLVMHLTIVSNVYFVAYAFNDFFLLTMLGVLFLIPKVHGHCRTFMGKTTRRVCFKNNLANQPLSNNQILEVLN